MPERSSGTVLASSLCGPRDLVRDTRGSVSVASRPKKRGSKKIKSRQARGVEGPERYIGKKYNNAQLLSVFGTISGTNSYRTTNNTKR